MNEFCRFFKRTLKDVFKVVFNPNTLRLGLLCHENSCHKRHYESHLFVFNIPVAMNGMDFVLTQDQCTANMINMQGVTCVTS